MDGLSLLVFHWVFSKLGNLIFLVTIRFVPCIVVYLLSYYTREETATRFAYVISVASVSQSFSELLSDYASQAPSHLGLSGWQWFLLMEGISGIIMGAIVWYYYDINR